MTCKRLMAPAVGILFLASAVPARAARFAGMKYLGGLPGVGRASGTLLLEGGELRFEDGKGRPLWHVPKKQEQAIADAVNRAVREAAAPIPE
jgi:hypothetical protein